jgi:hypothetical protein
VTRNENKSLIYDGAKSFNALKTKIAIFWSLRLYNVVLLALVNRE